MVEPNDAWADFIGRVSVEVTRPYITQLWLFSNPAFHISDLWGFETHLEVEDVYAMMRFGEWEEHRPSLDDARGIEEDAPGALVYLKCVPP